jgi:hypothetical protein
VSPLVLVHALVALGALPDIEVVQTSDASCPSTEAVQSSLARLRAGPADAGAPPHRLFLARADDRAHVELRDLAGQTLLARDLAVASTDCAGAADAIALIVDRYFHELAWAPPAAAPAPSAPPRDDAIGVAASVAPPETAREGRRQQAPRLALGAGPAFWTRTTGLGVALGGRVRLRGPVYVGLSALVPPFRATSSLGGGGRAEVSAVPLLPSIGAAGSFGRWTLSAGAGGLVTIEKGESQSIATPATAWRSVLALGLGAGAACRVAERLRVAVDAGGYRTALGRSFVVDGVQGDVLEPAPWQAVAMLTLEWIVWP